MRCPEGARPPDGWSLFVLVPLSNGVIRDYLQTRQLDVLINAIIDACVPSNGDIVVVQGEIPLDWGIVPLQVDLPAWMTVGADDAADIVRTAALPLRGWIYRWIIYGEVAWPLRIFLDRLEEGSFPRSHY
ncbi:hypothetical protein PoHVEF18_001070 [Penicillium ochrochloron]